jgi:membrane protein DedA with SNARE-associated domain/rhodanese-related sulfurtransferase
MSLLTELIYSGGIFVYALIFFAGLGLPIPLAPLLLLIGAGLAGAKVHPLAGAVVPPIMLSLGDIIWFYIGRVYGVTVLKSVCKLSLERDTCVKRTENYSARFGVKSMLFSRFVPGLSTLSAPMSGAAGDPLPKFILFDLGGVTLYSTFYLAIGFIFADRIKQIVESFQSASGSITYLILGLVIIYIAYKFTLRYWLVYQTHRLSIDPKTAHARRAADPAVLIADLRSPDDQRAQPFSAQGSQIFTASALIAHIQSLPKSTPIFLYCNCPNQASATALALRLRKLGFSNAHPIKDGLIGWQNANLPLNPLNPPTPQTLVALTVAATP